MKVGLNRGEESGPEGGAEIAGRRWWGTVSNALEKSIARMVVRVGGFRWLKPRAMDSVMGRRAVVVEWACLNPCCDSAKVKPAWRYGSTSRSSTFTVGERREIGL